MLPMTLHMKAKRAGVPQTVANALWLLTAIPITTLYGVTGLPIDYAYVNRVFDASLNIVGIALDAPAGVHRD